MILRSPESTRTYTLVPCTTLFRSSPPPPAGRGGLRFAAAGRLTRAKAHSGMAAFSGSAAGRLAPDPGGRELRYSPTNARGSLRSGEGRVGEACVRPCQSRLAPYHNKKTDYTQRVTLYIQVTINI